MSLPEEASRSLQAAWGLLRRDPAAPAAFNASVDGVWRSFVAALILAPVYILHFALAGAPETAEPIDPIRLWLVRGIGYVIGWFAWPLVAFYLARAYQRGERYLGYVAAYNWSQLLSVPLIVGVHALVFALADAGAAALAALVATGCMLVYEYLVALQMLALPPPRAASMVAMSFLLSLVLSDMVLFVLTASAQV